MVVCAGAAATHIVLHADKAARSYYGNFDMGLDLPPPARCQATCRPARAVGCALLGSHAHRMVIGDVLYLYAVSPSPRLPCASDDDWGC